MKDWVENNLRFSENKLLSLGNTHSDPKNHLYSNYLQYCKLSDYSSLSYSKFKMNFLKILNRESGLGHKFIVKNNKIIVSDVFFKPNKLAISFN